ncbi:hypothetical protein [Virgibacillus ndiopensis]|uniref:hypothetical protein n=1 Tax=Virgibacillus ndiopensis TaxID=2004408 RepID=UPI000C0814AB|nr:hypothetical protein [Virgibacillus ndiopensis]
MTEEERDSLFKQMHELPQHRKNSILSRIFGYFENATPNHETERFFKTVQEQVDEWVGNK